jgi:hypothetical protein
MKLLNNAPTVWGRGRMKKNGERKLAIFLSGQREKIRGWLEIRPAPR